MPSQKKKPEQCCNRVLDFIKDIFTYRMTVQQKFSKSAFVIPVWLVILLVIPFSHLVLIAVLVALIAGYRISFDHNR